MKVAVSGRMSSATSAIDSPDHPNHPACGIKRGRERDLLPDFNMVTDVAPILDLSVSRSMLNSTSDDSLPLSAKGDENLRLEVTGPETLREKLKDSCRESIALFANTGVSEAKCANTSALSRSSKLSSTNEEETTGGGVRMYLKGQRNSAFEMPYEKIFETRPLIVKAPIESASDASRLSMDAATIGHNAFRQLANCEDSRPSNSTASSRVARRSFVIENSLFSQRSSPCASQNVGCISFIVDEQAFDAGDEDRHLPSDAVDENEILSTRLSPSIAIEPKQSNGVRRSSRKRVAPLRFWLGEQAVYRVNEQGDRELVDVSTVRIQDAFLIEHNTASPRVAMQRKVQRTNQRSTKRRQTDQSLRRSCRRHVIRTQFA
uniref:Uncharacterized protein n=1 Tax=Parascaris univalens TaxID=6257 RepID=A0A915A9U9_PARUN